MQTTADNLLVIDALNLAFRWKHSGATDFAEDYLRTVQSLQRSYKANWVVLASDQGSSEYRKTIYPLYKQNRKEKRDQQTEAERLAFEQFFADYLVTLEHIKQNTDYPILRFQGVEADDIAAYITQLKLPVAHTWLASSDKDWDLLVDDRVSRFSYVTRKETTLQNWHTHYEFSQDQYISIKCLMGDSGDGVPGVPGVGPKRAVDLVQRFGSTWDIIASLPIAGKYKYIEALNTFGAEQLILNYKLMDLQTHCKDALGIDNCATIKHTLETYVNN